MELRPAAAASSTIEFSGPDNRGFQLGQNSGTINVGWSHFGDWISHTYNVGNSNKPPERPWMVPRESNRFFIGRKDALLHLERALKVRDNLGTNIERPRRFVIAGLGGIGKSEICIKFAEKQRERYWGVFWVDCFDENTIKVSFEQIGYLLGIAELDIGKVKSHLSGTTKEWLLVIDNADNTTEDYSRYFPYSVRGDIIITTRDPELLSRYSTVGSLTLDELDETVAQELLLRSADVPKEQWPSRAAAADELARELGHHTLAILQAGAYIKDFCQFEDYLQLYKRNHGILLKRVDDREQRRYRTVHATFNISVIRLRELCVAGLQEAADALHLLNVLAFWSPDSQAKLIFTRARRCALSIFREPNYIDDIYGPCISHWNAREVPGFAPRGDGSDDDGMRWQRASGRLRALSLLSITDYNKDNERLSFHPLVHVWNKKRQPVPARRANWLTAATILALSCEKNQDYDPFMEFIKSHVSECILHDEHWLSADRIDRRISAIVLQLAWVQYCVGATSDSVTILDRLPGLSSNAIQEVLKDLQLRTKMFFWRNASKAERRGTQVRTDTVYPQIQKLKGLMLLRQRNTVDAIKLLRHVSQITESLGERHPAQLSSQHNLAKAYLQNGQVKDAIKLFEHVVRIQEQRLEESHPRRLKPQFYLAKAYLADGRRIEDAIKLLEHIVRIQEGRLEESHPERLTPQFNLAKAYLADERRIEDAIKLLEHIVRIEEQRLEESHTRRLPPLYELGKAYLADGRRIEDAIKLLERVVRIQEQRLEESHPQRVRSQYELARAYFADERRIEDAIKLLEHIVRIKEQNMDKWNPTVLKTERLLAHAYERNGQVEEATKLQEYISLYEE